MSQMNRGRCSFSTWKKLDNANELKGENSFVWIYLSDCNLMWSYLFWKITHCSRGPELLLFCLDKIAFLGLCILKELVLKFLHPVFKSLIKKNKWMAIKHLKSVNTMPGLPFWLLCEPVWNHRGGGTAGGRAGGSCIPPLETELRIQHPDCHYKPIRYKRCRDRSGTTLHGLSEYPVTVHWTLNLYWVKPLHRAHLVVSDSSPDLNVTAFVGFYMGWVSGISTTSDYG